MKRFLSFTVTCAMLFCCVFLSGCSNSEKTIELAYDNTAEEAIIANMLCRLIEKNTDINVEVTGDYPSGGVVMHPAMMNGDIDLYPEYTGTAWLDILKHTDIPDTDILNERLFREYQDEFGITWCGMYGFNNTMGIAVSKEIAEQYALETYSDLARVADRIVLGAEGSFFERPGGFEGLCETYGMNFKDTMDITFSLKYDAIAEGTVNAICIWTTDAKIVSSGVKVLRDDKNYFTKYLAGTVIRTDVLEKYPELEDVLMLMDGLINDEEMTRLNYYVVCDGQEPEDVAVDYLTEKGLL